MTRFKNILRNLSLLIKIAWEEDKVLLVGYFVTSFISVGLLFITYFFYKLMIDQVFRDIGATASTILFLAIVGYLLVEYLSRFVTNTLNSFYFEFILRSKFQNALTRLFMRKLADLDFTNLENGEVRNLIAKVADTFTWRVQDNLRMINNIIYNLAAIVGSFIVASQFNLGYFILLAVFATPLYFIRAKFGNVQWTIYTSQSKKVNYLWYLRYLFTEFDTLSEIKIYRLKDHLLNKAREIQDEMIEKYKKPIIQQTIISSVVSFILPVTIFFALRNFVVDIVNNRQTIGDFTFLLNALYTFIGQISALLLNFGAIYENNLYVQDYFQLQNLENKIKSPANSYRLKNKVPKEIKFVNVFFKYPESETYALENINLTIKKGEDIAIVGHNGAGKTTLIKLLLRFYDPTSGQILVDGRPLRKINLNDWYEKLGVLFQDFAKYNLSLRENIGFGNIDEFKKMEFWEGGDEQSTTLPKQNSNKARSRFVRSLFSKIKDALEKAHGQDIAKIKKGYDQLLGSWFEDGTEISIGQWQKVAIARALYRNAPFLVLDEPTSNIDPQAEYKIFNNLKSLYKNKNLIFISHRFSTVRMADKIYVLEKGKLIEEGNHEELLKNNKLYARFFKIQKKGYE